MDIDKIPRAIVDDLHSRGFTDSQIANMKPERAFDEFCSWHGLLGGWGDILIGALDALRAADEGNVPDVVANQKDGSNHD